jgi:hypothetical protein
MNKAQKRELALIDMYIAHGMKDTAARSIGALIRCAMTNKAKKELLQIAIKLELACEPEFIYY